MRTFSLIAGALFLPSIASAFEIDVTWEELHDPVVADLVVGDTGRVEIASLCAQDRKLVLPSYAEIVREDQTSRSVLYVTRHPANEFTLSLAKPGEEGGEDDRRRREVLVGLLLAEVRVIACESARPINAANESTYAIRSIEGAERLSELIGDQP